MLMKKLLLTYIFITFANLCYSQEQDYTLEGLFDFRLGMSVAELKEIVDTTQLNQGEPDENMPNEEWFFLDEYVVLEKNNYILRDIGFLFRNDKLYLIVIGDYNKTTEGFLSQVYGKPEERIERTEEYEKTEYIWDTKIRDVLCASSLEVNPKTMEIISYQLVIGYSSIVSGYTLKGLYNFRLGMSIDEMKEIVNISELEEQKSSSCDEGYTEFLLSKHDLSDENNDFMLRDIRLYFYDNQLYQITLNHYDARTEKNLYRLYGNQEEKVIEDTEDRLEILYSWDTNIKDIYCLAKHEINPENNEIINYNLTVVDFGAAIHAQMDQLGIESYQRYIEKIRGKSR